jgi:hypothetical protein
MGFADLGPSFAATAGPLRLRSGLWPSAIGRNDDRLRRGEISTPPSQRAGSSGTRFCAARL